MSIEDNLFPIKQKLNFPNEIIALIEHMNRKYSKELTNHITKRDLIYLKTVDYVQHKFKNKCLYEMKKLKDFKNTINNLNKDEIPKKNLDELENLKANLFNCYSPFYNMLKNVYKRYYICYEMVELPFYLCLEKVSQDFEKNKDLLLSEKNIEKCYYLITEFNIPLVSKLEKKNKEYFKQDKRDLDSIMKYDFLRPNIL